MTPLSLELDQLSSDLSTGSWAPTPAERAAAAEIAGLQELTCLGIRAALTPARTTRSRLVMTYERIAGVLNLPPIHEEISHREQLVEQALLVAAQIADAETRTITA